MGTQESVPCQSWWNAAVTTASSIKTYAQVVQYMFEDGKVNRGRLEVLEVFTKDVCVMYPHLTNGIWAHYESVLLVINGPVSVSGE